MLTGDDVDAAGREQDLGDAAGVAAQRHALQAPGLLQGGRAREQAGRARGRMAPRLLAAPVHPRQPLLQAPLQSLFSHYTS